MMFPDVVAKSIETLQICRDLIVFNPMTGEDIDPLFLNEDNRALYEGIGNVLAYIQQLEVENTKLHNANDELCRTAGRLERERDAAVQDIKRMVHDPYEPCFCDYCKLTEEECAGSDCKGRSAFVWRGPQEVTP